MGNQCQGAAAQNAARKPGDPLVLSVVRTAAWGLGAEEDVWQVEVPGGVKVRDLKQAVEELYGVDAAAQRLSLTAATTDPALGDDAETEALAGKKIYMNPVPMEEMLGMGMGMGGDEEAEAAMAEAIMGQLAEAAEQNSALLESLQGVVYNVTFKRPQDAGGKVAGKELKLELDALATMDIVQQMVDVEMFGASPSDEPTFLVFEGTHLPHHATLFHAGVESGKTIIVSKDPPPNEEEQLMSLLAASAAEAGGPQ